VTPGLGESILQPVGEKHAVGKSRHDVVQRQVPRLFLLELDVR
jgi:hypothetical protein